MIPAKFFLQILPVYQLHSHLKEREREREGRKNGREKEISSFTTSLFFKFNRPIKREFECSFTDRLKL